MRLPRGSAHFNSGMKEDVTKYKKYTITTTTEAEDIIASILYDLGIEGVEIEDSLIPSEIENSGLFWDELPESTVPSGEARISFYLDSSAGDDDIDKAIRALVREIDDLRQSVDVGDGSIAVTITDDEDWLNKWKEFFHRFTIDFEDGRRALFIPTWESDGSVDNSFDWTVRTDPGASFGSGAHESTRLCIRALEKYVKEGDRLLDVGTGSGILSVMAFKFGASYCAATDLDPCTPYAVKKNFEVNFLEGDNFTLKDGDIITDAALREQIGNNFDIVVANILPNILKELTPIVPRLLKKDGIYIISGIIDEKAAFCEDFLKSGGFEILERRELGEWVSYVSVLH